MTPPDLVQRLLWVVICKPPDTLNARIGIEIEALSISNRVLARGVVDDQGLVKFTKLAGPDNQSHRERKEAEVIRRGGDLRGM